MKRYFISITFLLFAFNTIAQNNMRPVNDLINKDDSGWMIVKEWLKSAKNKVVLLPVDTAKAKDALFKTQVTTASPMGAIVYRTGGLLIDNGWIRILGSGNSKLNRSLPDWNKGKSFQEFGTAPSFLLIADDAIGGFFILNGGGLGQDLGKVYYFSPDNLEYEPLDMSYSEFLLFCFNDNLDGFYEGKRWTNWKAEVSKLSGDEVYSFFPYLYTKQGSDINKISRKVVPIKEQYDFNLEMQETLERKKQ